jgi:hypothetical protein
VRSCGSRRRNVPSISTPPPPSPLHPSGSPCFCLCASVASPPPLPGHRCHTSPTTHLDSADDRGESSAARKACSAIDRAGVRGEEARGEGGATVETYRFLWTPDPVRRGASEGIVRICVLVIGAWDRKQDGRSGDTIPQGGRNRLNLASESSADLGYGLKCVVTGDGAVGKVCAEIRPAIWPRS